MPAKKTYPTRDPHQAQGEASEGLIRRCVELEDTRHEYQLAAVAWGRLLPSAALHGLTQCLLLGVSLQH